MLEAIPNPFKSEEIVTVRGPEGSTIADLLEAAEIRWRRYGGGVCWIEDAERRLEPVAIPRALWHRVRPKAGTVTTVKLMPGFGGGSGGGKSMLATVLALAVAVVAIIVAPYLAGVLGFTVAAGYSAATVAAVTAGIAAGINIVGNLAISALIAPPRPRSTAEIAASAANDRQGFTIQGTGNRARPYQKIPLQLGRLRRWPDLAAEFVTEPRGNDVYLRFLMVLGWGPLKAEDWKIGETPISEYEGVRFNYREGWADDAPPAIYTADVHTEGLSVQLTQAGGWVTRETAEGADEIQVELAFPEGLVRFPDPGTDHMASTWVDFEAEMAKAGTEDWAPIAWFNAGEPGFGTPGDIRVEDMTRSGQPRRIGRIMPDNTGHPTKKWRVRLKRLSVDTPDNTPRFDDSYWTALKTIKHTTPLPLLGKVAWIEGEIKASGQLNGTLQELNCIASSYARKIDAGGFLGSWADTGAAHPNWTISRNPAELFAHVATHPYALPKKIADSRLDFGGLADWRDDAAQVWTHGKPRFRFDRVYETGSTLARVLDEVAAVGRARRAMPGGKHGVVRDIPQAAVKQHYTPRNSSGYRIEIPFRRRLHGIRVRFNKDGLGQEAEIVVYADGYSADGSAPGTIAATELETAEAIGQTEEELVWCLWRYHLAVQELRPHTHEWNTGVENLKSGRGALVRLTHDVPGFGLAHGRTKSAATNGGGDFTSVTLDASVTFEPGKGYGVRLRTHAGSFYTTLLNPAVTAPVTASTLTFSVPQPTSWGLNAVIDAGTGEIEQDIFGFGEADKESAEMLILGVTPGANLSAKLMAVDAAPGVHDADLGTIPAFDPQVTLPPADARKPPPPVIRDIKSDESVMIQRVGGALVVRFLAEFDPPQGLPVPVHIQARWRASAASPWTVGNLQPAASLAYSGETVQQGVEYTIEFRYIPAVGEASDWARRVHTIVGKTTPPPDIAALYLEGEHIRWPYPNAPLDVTYGGGFAARYHYGNVGADDSVWGAANRPHDDLISGTAFPLALLPPGEITILVKAVDADGNESAAAAKLFTEIVGPVPANIVLARDYEAEGFPGVIENGSVQGGDVVSDSASIFYTPGGVPMWTNPAPVYGDQFDVVEYRFALDVTGDMVPGRLALEHEIDGANRRIDYWVPVRGVPFYGSGLLYAADPFYGPGEWRAWPGALDIAEAGAVNARIQAGGGSSLGAVRALTASFDVEDVEENLLNVTIAMGGSPAPVTKTYRKFTHVVPVLVDDGGSARGVRIQTTLPSDAAPIIECLDAAGASTAGRVNLQPIKGY